MSFLSNHLRFLYFKPADGTPIIWERSSITNPIFSNFIYTYLILYIYFLSLSFLKILAQASATGSPYKKDLTKTVDVDKGSDFEF